MSRALKTPDITKAQVVALSVGIGGVLASMGMPLSEANQNRLTLVCVALAVTMKLSDAVIRFGRALMAGKKIDNIDLGLDEPED